MQPDEVVARARSMIGKRTVYHLGHGGMRPEAPVAYDMERECDCSGFAAWCLGVSRKTDHPWYVALNGGWLQTSAIVRDLGTGYGSFDGVAWTHGQPGDLLVWPDRVVDGVKHHGHVGVVSAVDETGPTLVIHCSEGNFRASGGLEVPLNPKADAVAETSVLIFREREALVARWCEHAEQAVA